MAHLSKLPIAGRAVLLDVDRFLQKSDSGIDHQAGTAVTADVLEQTLQAQSTELRAGDILLIRFVSLRWYFDDATHQQRADLVDLAGR